MRTWTAFTADMPIKDRRYLMSVAFEEREEYAFPVPIMTKEIPRSIGEWMATESEIENRSEL